MIDKIEEEFEAMTDKDNKPIKKQVPRYFATIKEGSVIWEIEAESKKELQIKIDSIAEKGNSFEIVKIIKGHQLKFFTTKVVSFE